jgi:hypothetical protein
MRDGADRFRGCVLVSAGPVAWPGTVVREVSCEDPMIGWEGQVLGFAFSRGGGLVGSFCHFVAVVE